MSEKKPEKKSIGKQLAQEFIQKDMKDIERYIVHDKVMPAIKKGILDFGFAILDGFKGSFSMLLYGDDRPATTTQSRPIQVSYQSYYNQNRQQTNKPKSGSSFHVVSYDSKAKAEEVLASLQELSGRGYFVTVNDYYEMSGYETGDSAWNNYGWTDLSQASVGVSPDGGFVINLPKAVFKS